MHVTVPLSVWLLGLWVKHDCFFGCLVFYMFVCWVCVSSSILELCSHLEGRYLEILGGFELDLQSGCQPLALGSRGPNLMPPHVNGFSAAPCALEMVLCSSWACVRLWLLPHMCPSAEMQGSSGPPALWSSPLSGTSCSMTASPCVLNTGTIGLCGIPILAPWPGLSRP